MGSGGRGDGARGARFIVDASYTSLTAAMKKEGDEEEKEE